MYKIQKSILVIFVSALVLSLSACLPISLLSLSKETTASSEVSSASSKENSSSSTDNSSSTKKSTSSTETNAPSSNLNNQVKESTSDSVPEDINGISTTQLQSLYAKAPEYDYMALGYYISGFDNNEMVRDGYVPYDENFTQEETNSLESSAHGVSIRLSMQKATSASEALEVLSSDYLTRCEAEGLTFVDKSDVVTADNDTVGFIQYICETETGEDIFVILYADIRDTGRIYMCAEMELNPVDFDDKTKALVAEVDDVYALTLSNLSMISSL